MSTIDPRLDAPPMDVLKDAFLSALSHELRTPVTVLRGYAATLRRIESEGIELSRDQRLAMLDAMVDRADQLDHLVSDLLDFDSVASGLLAAHRRTSEIRSLILRVAEYVNVGDHPLEIDSPAALVNIDVAKVERMVESLLRNAAKYSAPGTRIRILARVESSELRIEVEDLGPGIPDAVKEEIYAPLQHGPGASAHSPGTGMGLALVAAFAGLHGGRAWIEDGPAGGTRSRIQLPLDDPFIPGTAPS
jgi:signal transduction histidine kinase